MQSSCNILVVLLEVYYQDYAPPEQFKCFSTTEANLTPTGGNDCRNNDDKLPWTLKGWYNKLILIFYNPLILSGSETDLSVFCNILTLLPYLLLFSFWSESWSILPLKKYRKYNVIVTSSPDPFSLGRRGVGRYFIMILAINKRFFEF